MLLQLFTHAKTCLSCICSPLHALGCKNKCCFICWKTRMDDNISGCEAQLLNPTDVGFGIDSKSAQIHPLVDVKKPLVMLNEEETCGSGSKALLQPDPKHKNMLSNPDPELEVLLNELEPEVLLSATEHDGLTSTEPEVELEAVLTGVEPGAELTTAETEAELTEAQPEAELIEAQAEAELIEAQAEAELIKAQAETELTEAQFEAELTEAPPEAELSNAEVEAELTEAQPEAELAEADPDAELAVAEPVAMQTEAEPETGLSEVLPETELEAVLSKTESEAALFEAGPETELEAVLTEAELEAVLTEAELNVALTEAVPEALLTKKELEAVLTKEVAEAVPNEAELEALLTEAEPEAVLTEAELEALLTEAELQVVLPDAEPEVVLTDAEQEAVLTVAEQEAVLTVAEQEAVLTVAEPEAVLTEAVLQAVLSESEPEAVLTEAKPEALLTEAKPEALLTLAELDVLIGPDPEILLNKIKLGVLLTQTDEEVQNCLQGEWPLFENSIQHEKDQAEIELLDDTATNVSDFMESCRFYDGTALGPSETSNLFLNSETETDEQVDQLIESSNDLISVSERECVTSELLVKEDTAMTENHNIVHSDIIFHSIVDNSSVVDDGINTLVVGCTPSNPDHCESLPDPEDYPNPVQISPNLRENKALCVQSHPLSDFLSDGTVSADYAQTAASTSYISMAALSTDAVSTISSCSLQSDAIVADTISNANNDFPPPDGDAGSHSGLYNLLQLHPAQWCDHCGRLAELEEVNANCCFDKPLDDDSGALADGTSQLERCLGHLPGCKYWMEPVPPFDGLLDENGAVSVGAGDADTGVAFANKTDEGCDSRNGSSDLVNTVDELFTLAMPSIIDNDTSGGKSSVNFSVVDLISNFAIPGTQPNSDGTNLSSSSKGVEFIRDVIDVAPSDCLDRLTIGDAVLNKTSADFPETAAVTVACNTIGVINNVSNNTGCGVSTSRTESVLSNNIFTSRTEEVVSNCSCVTSKQESSRNCEMKQNTIERQSVKQSNFSASSQELDPVDIGCGFASLGSVLFEKCKTRRCEVSVSKEIVSAVSVVEGIGTSHLESCSLSDTPLYVPPEPSPPLKEYPSGDLEADILKSSSSFPNATNAAVDNPDPISTIYPAHDRPVGVSISERRLGVFGSQSNPCILEEVDENGVISGHHLGDNAAAARISYMDSVAPRDKVPLYKEAGREEVIATTSAPCSPVPQGAATIYSGERRRKHNTCARRRVSFPEDDTRLITSYLEPVDPWERMKTSVTSDEVMAAYVSSCTSHSCQPIPAVLNQIAALPLNIPGRVECFSLRGCKLELSQCEGLEEIFKRVQFVNIDFENCSLTDDTVIPLVDMIEFYDSTTQLNISGNSHIGSRGWQACARMLKKTQSVHYLDARNTNLNEVNMPILGKALKLGTRLHTLHLENCNLTGRPLITLAAALKLNDTLVKLYLADNRLGSNDCIQIGNLVRNNLTLKLLDLRNNNLQDAGCAHVCEGVVEQNKQSVTAAQKTPGMTDKSKTKNVQTGLNSLVLWNNHMTVTSARHLASMMLSTTSLETLNVGRNSITNDGVIRMKDSLLRNKSLRRLYLHATKIGDEGAVALAEFIAESKHIERVDLRDNTIKVAGLLALAHSLRHNSSVVQMDLDSNPRAESVSELAEKHVSLLFEIKDYACRNRTQNHLAAQENKDSDTEDYNLDPDFRKLSLSSEIAEGGHINLEVPTTPVSGSSSRSGSVGEEHKKYRSPSPSPCGSPVPSPSPSPIPSPSRNRFKVFKVTPDSSPTASVAATPNPLFTGDGFGSPMSHLFSNNSTSLSSSAPVASNIALSTTSRPVFYQPQPVVRNRFLSGGGSRFTVTKVTDTGLSNLQNLKSKSASLSNIPKPAIELGQAIASEPSSPQIVISSPAKIERGFSLDEGAIEDAITQNKLKENASNPAPVEMTASNPDLEKDDAPTCLMSATLVKIKSDSTESDDVFVDSVSSHSPENFVERGCVGLHLPPAADGGGLSPNSTARRELTDSGFLEEPNPVFEDALTSLPIRPATSQDGDRDSLFSNTSDNGGHSPLLPIPPDGKPLSPSFLTHPLPPFHSSKSVGPSSPNHAPSITTSPVLSPASKLVPSPPSDRMRRSTSSESANSLLLRPAQQRAPLASMENGSFDTDSEDSELTTQSSDSTHSDEVRITAEGEVVPQAAWGLASAKMDGVETSQMSTSEAEEEAVAADDVSTEELRVRTSQEEATEKLDTCRVEAIHLIDARKASCCSGTDEVHEDSVDHAQESNDPNEVT